MGPDRNEERTGWITLSCVVVFVTAVQVFLAMRFSLWTDELAAIAPAVAPWRGAESFWTILGRYVANPPGENLVLRGLYRLSSLRWLREASQELFWRIPYVFVYALTAGVTYFYAKRWSRSALVAFAVLTLFLCSPGPFTWATETRFYEWAILFMTCAVWESIAFVENGFRRRDLVRVSCFSTVGALFHVSLALIAYLLLAYSLYTAFVTARRWKREGLALASPTIRAAAVEVFFGILPFLVYQYEKKHWMYVPAGSSFRSVFSLSFFKAFTSIPNHTKAILPFGFVGNAFGASAFGIGLLYLLVVGIRRRQSKRVIIALFFLALSFGASAMLLLSSPGFDLLDRHFLFLVPIVLSGFTYAFYVSARDRDSKIPPPVRSVAIVIMGFFIAANTISLASRALVQGSSAKLNYGLAGFRSFYTALPDRRNLVLVGVGNGKPLVTDDLGGWIGATQTFYTEEFSPVFLNRREKPTWNVPDTPSGWSKYEFLIFVPPGSEPNMRGLAWEKLKCFSFPWGKLRFCR